MYLPILSAIVCVVGLLIYVLTKSELPKLQEVGRIMFEMGLLAFLLTGGKIVIG